MTTAHLVFMLEERSAMEMLDGLLPRFLTPEVSWRYIVFEGKQDLEKQLTRRIRGYHIAGARFVVVRDQDSGDCRLIKQRLLDLCRAGGCPETLIRIACRELESWYLADLEAVETGLGLHGLAKLQNKKKYRNPDHLAVPSMELRRITGGIYQKISGSRVIGRNLNIANTRSNSFRVFIEGLKTIAIPGR